MAAALYLLIPKRSDVASLRLSANQIESLQLTKEGLDPSVFSDQPALIRKWVSLLREDGRTAEGLRFARELVRLRPKNTLYWEILRQALVDENLQAEELKVRLQMISSGMLAAKRLDYLEIATLYKWLGKYADYVRVLELMIERDVYTHDEISFLLQAYASSDFTSAQREAKVAALIERLRPGKLYAAETHEKLAAYYAAFQQPAESAFHAAQAVGLDEKAARDFAAGHDASPALLAAVEALASNKLESLIDLAHSHGRPALTLHLYQALRNRGALSFSRYFDYVNVSAKLGHKDEAVRLAREIPQRLRLDSVQWFQLAQVLGSLGQRDQSIRIMQRLLAERS